MLVQSVTVGLPVSDLRRSVEWYRAAFQLDEPDLEPVEAVVEFKIGAVWLQLVHGAAGPGRGGAVVRLGVADVTAERSRLAGLGIAVGGLEQVDSVLEYFDFADPDGNQLSLYAEIEP